MKVTDLFTISYIIPLQSCMDIALPSKHENYETARIPYKLADLGLTRGTLTLMVHVGQNWASPLPKLIKILKLERVYEYRTNTFGRQYVVVDFNFRLTQFSIKSYQWNNNYNYALELNIRIVIKITIHTSCNFYWTLWSTVCVRREEILFLNFNFNCIYNFVIKSKFVGKAIL